MSPEMEIPKLMWLKRHRPDLWQQAGLFLDLADFLTWKATGSAARSRCTLTAKWTYMAQSNNGWQRDFLASVGLEDLTDRGGLPDDTVPIGSAVGTLSAEAAAAFGLDEGIPVGAGMVDAYAGALGVLGSSEGDDDSLDGQVAIIGGTSSCIIAFAREPRFGRSLWGPYYESVFPEHWLVEAGQSATGGLLNHLLQIHSATADSSVPRHQQVIARILELKAEEGPTSPRGSISCPISTATAPLRRSPHDRRDLGPDAGYLVRRPVPSLLARLRGNRAGTEADPEHDGQGRLYP